MPEPKNAISWVSIPAKDFDRAVRFYSNILDRTLEPMGEGDDKMAPFFPLETPGVNGGITADPSFTPTSDGVRIYLDVRGELENILERIEEAGGNIVEGKSSLGEHGWYAIISDTEGNTIGLHSYE